MKRDLLPLVTVDGRHAGELIAHPCACGRPHALGEHLWDSTRNMAPGPRAANTDPRARTWPTDTDRPDPIDTTDQLHDRYKTLLDVYHQAARNLIRFIDANRPDRTIPLPEPLTDDDWCRNHLTIGICEPRYRGDLCAWCYSVGYAHGHAPDAILMRHRHQGGRLTTTVIEDFLARVKPLRKAKGKGKRAS